MIINDGYHVVSIGSPDAARIIAHVRNINDTVKAIKFFGETSSHRVHEDKLITFGKQPQLYYHGFIDLGVAV